MRFNLFTILLSMSAFLRYSLDVTTPVGQACNMSALDHRMQANWHLQMLTGIAIDYWHCWLYSSKNNRRNALLMKVCSFLLPVCHQSAEDIECLVMHVLDGSPFDRISKRTAVLNLRLVFFS
jgi:hypothetical protein